MIPFLRPRPVDDPAIRLIGFHHAGGSAAVYYPFTRELPDDWDLLLLDLPGRGRRFGRAPLRGMDEVITRVVDDLRPWLTGPYALFGHSLGAIVATEAGRTLDSTGSPPVWVGVSGRVAPGLHESEKRRLHELPDPELLDVMHELGGMPERVAESPEFLARFLATVRADLGAVFSYLPHATRPQLSCPLTALGGTSDSWAPPAKMHLWSQETGNRFSQKFFPGGHFYFMADGFRSLTAEIVRQIEIALPEYTDHADSVASVA